MSRSITARELFDDLHQRLGLAWVSENGSGEDITISSDELSARPALAGFLNLIHPNKVQVLGEEEITYLDALDGPERKATVARIFESQPLAVVVGEGFDMPQTIASAAAGSATALLCSRLPSYVLVNFLQHHISHKLAHRITLHGVFMEVFTIGVLITGGAGSGKSELALELLNRGHRLIADDAPEFTQISPDVIDGGCPEALQDCLEVRGLGILNVRRMFGDAAIKLNKFLRLIIHLEIPADASNPQASGREPDNRLRSDSSSQRVLDLNIARITLPVMAGRNLAVLAEAAVRDYMLKMKGYDAASAFIERHSRLLQRQEQDLSD
ncbi:MAG: HPr(Ser) kinase/phosphatase [Xanthomonadales bacterium]|nr:HPr(Ser) kinase/phosphatase [Xanthomonadales bacterium]